MLRKNIVVTCLLSLVCVFAIGGCDRPPDEVGDCAFVKHQKVVVTRGFHRGRRGTVVRADEYRGEWEYLVMFEMRPEQVVGDFERIREASLKN